MVDLFTAGDVDAVDAWVHDRARDMADQVERARAFADRVAAVSATASSPDGAVLVTVAASGEIRDLRLEERVRQWPAGRIAEQIQAVMRRAQGDLAAKVAAAAAQTVGEHSMTGRAVVDTFASRFPPPPPESYRPTESYRPAEERRGR